jgi:hypothetical protein
MWAIVLRTAILQTSKCRCGPWRTRLTDQRDHLAEFDLVANGDEILRVVTVARSQPAAVIELDQVAEALRGPDHDDTVRDRQPASRGARRNRFTDAPRGP